MTDLSQIWGQLIGRSEWHDQDLKLCEWFFDAATKLELAGKIAPAAAEQARAYLAAHVLKEHIYESPKVYRALRKEDSDGDNIIDMLRNKIGGDRDESSGATDERRNQSFALLAQTAADVGLHEGAVDMATYRQLMAYAAPDELQAVDQQMLKRPKDDGPRSLDDEWLTPANEEGVNATATELWLRRQGVGNVPDAPEPEPAATGESEGRASDWSESRLEKYFAKRDREQGIVHPNMSEPQDGPRGPVVPDHAGFDERPYDPTTGE